MDGVAAGGLRVPFLIFLKSFEVLLYEVMSWLVFYPRTMWRSIRHPLSLMERTEDELKLTPAEQFRDVVSPPIFLLLTVVAANGIEVPFVALPRSSRLSDHAGHRLLHSIAKTLLVSPQSVGRKGQPRSNKPLRWSRQGGFKGQALRVREPPAQRRR